MGGLLEIEDTLIDKSRIRGSILDFEGGLLKQPRALRGDNYLCPLKHTFSDGIYVREIFIPKGVVLTGKIHRHAHPNFLMSGEVDVITEGGGVERIKAPCSMISAKGTKRIVMALEDCVWITVHLNPSNTQDLRKLEDLIIAKTYNELENKSLFKKLLNIFKLK